MPYNFDQNILFQTVVGKAPNSIFVLNLRGDVVYANSIALETFGYAQNELVGKKGDIILPGEIFENVKKESFNEKSTGYGNHKSGSHIPIEIRINSIELESQKYLLICLVDKSQNQQLLIENQRFSVATKTSGGGVWDWNLKTNELIWDDKMFEIYETPHKFSSIYEEWKRCLHPEDSKKAEEVLQNALKNHQEFHTSFRIICGGKKTKYIKADGKIIYDEFEKPIKMVGLNYDITEKVKLEAKLKKLALISEKTSNIIIVTDSEEKIESVNESFTEKIGYSLEEVLGKKPGSFLQGEKTNLEAISYMNQMISEKKSLRVEILNYTKDKKEIWLDIEIQPIFDEQGVLINFIAIESDITERKKNEIQLRESEERFRLLMEAVPALIWMSDAKKQYIYFNQKWLKYRGQNFEEEKKQGRLEGIHPDERDAISENFLKAFEERKEFLFKYRLKKYDGMYRWFLESGVPRYDPNKNFLGYIGICTDITEMKELEELKNEFISIVSHEIRTPLTSIRGSLGLIDLKSIDSEEVKKLLSIALQNSELLSGLVDDILDIQKMETDEIEVHLEKIYVKDILEKAMNLNLNKAEQKKSSIRIETTLQEEKVLGDRIRLIQVLGNLIDNAIKYSPEKDEIIVRAFRKNGKIRIEVEDHGPGIPEEFRSRIFEKYAQYETSDLRKSKGTGLGLYICRKILERHESSIHYSSEKNLTIFYFELDLAS